MTVIRNGNQLEVMITTKHDIRKGNIFTGDGRVISASQFIQINQNQFQTFIGLPNVATQIIYFYDGVHPAKKLIVDLIPTQGMQTFDLSLKSSLTIKRFQTAIQLTEQKILFKLEMMLQ